MKLTSRILMYPLIMVMFLMLTISCSKKDEVNDSNKSQLELLTSHQWKYSSRTLNGAPHTIDECQKDNHFFWNSDGIFNYNYGLVKCNTGETNGTVDFSLSVDLKTIIYGGYGAQYNEHDDIAMLTETKMVLTSTSAEGDWEDTYIPY